MNKLFRNALSREIQAVPPIWMMRQAGRYHKHYQNLRSKHSFIELCKNGDLASEVAMGPIQDFDFDVAILFSDLLFPLEALGMGLSYEPAPKLGWHLRPDNFNNLKSAAEALPDLQFQKKAMQLTREKLPANKSLVGFVGGPWTLFSYAVEGGHHGSLVEAKKHLALLPKFCEILVPLLIENIRLQLEGGAEIVMIFDTAAGELSPALFHEHVVPALAQLSSAHPGKLAYYSKGTHRSYLLNPYFSTAPLAGLGVDHRWDLRLAFELSKNGFVQGNFDQALLHMEPADFDKELMRFLRPFKEWGPEKYRGWVCGLGHGILPATPERNVKHFVETVRNFLST